MAAFSQPASAIFIISVCFSCSLAAHLVRPFCMPKAAPQTPPPPSTTTTLLLLALRKRRRVRERERESVIQCRTSCQMKPILLFSAKKQSRGSSRQILSIPASRERKLCAFHAAHFFIAYFPVLQTHFILLLVLAIALRSFPFRFVPFVCQRLTKSVNVLCFVCSL